MEIFKGELLGTMILVLMGNGAVASVVLNRSKAQNSGWIVITAGWAFGVMTGVFTAQAFGSTGAHINPAVTLSMIVLGVPGVLGNALVYVAGQVTGAAIGAVLVWLTYLPHWPISEDADSKLACFSTGPAVRSPGKNLVSEAIGTFVLIMGVLAISQTQTPVTGLEVSPGVAPYLIGILVWGIGLSLGGATGYAINPARDLGPRLVHTLLPIAGKRDSDWGYAWVPVIGPLLGGSAAGILVFMLG
jgi:glycerol uptake facilitator protein